MGKKLLAVTEEDNPEKDIPKLASLLKNKINLRNLVLVPINLKI